MELDGKRVIILVEDMFNDQEFWYPYYRLKEAGAEVVIVGSGSAPEYTGKAGTRAKADASADEILPANIADVAANFYHTGKRRLIYSIHLLIGLLKMFSKCILIQAKSLR